MTSGEIATLIIGVGLAAEFLPRLFPRHPPELIWACMVGAGIVCAFVALYIGHRKQRKG